MSIVTLDEFRVYSGATSVPDFILESVLAEAESSILAELDIPLDDIIANDYAYSIMYGVETRRAQRLLARRASPEGVSGMGDLGIIQIPSRDPDDSFSMWRLRSLLLIPEAIA